MIKLCDLPDQEEQVRIFQPIINQFRNMDVSCSLMQDLLNWHIKVTATVRLGNGNQYTVTRSTRDLSEQDELAVVVEINSLVHALERAISRVAFINPNAPNLYTWAKEQKSD